MRYDKDHKETTRRRIVETAAREFRLRGFDGIGIAEVMKKTGLTHGGFYSHFASKDELVAAALQEAFAQGRTQVARSGLGTEGEGGLETMIRYYLSPAHRDQPEAGCAIAGLVGEVGRENAGARDVFTSNLKLSLALVESLLPGSPPAAKRRQTAAAIFATLVGALQLARATATANVAASQRMLEAGIAGALALAKTLEGEDG